MNLFRTVDITIANKAYNVLLFADDQLHFDDATQTLYFNEAMVTGSIVFTEALTKEAKPIENLIKMGVVCIKTSLPSDIFQQILKADKQELAQFLISKDRQERELASNLLQKFKE
jgi:cell division protein ZapA (FtsZ GTPase activity inhibitor)